MSKPTDQHLSLSVTPIGYIRTKMRTKFDSPHQPKNSDEERNIIELIPGMRLDLALKDLASFNRIWLVWWFHRNSSWKPLVLPPRGTAKRRGVFATRSPHRPNPIGITSLPLIGIEGSNLIVGKADLVDGTPILDIKPYLATVDAFPEASLGWLSDVESQHAEPPPYTTTFAPLAEEQLAWLRTEWNVDFQERMSEILSRDPSIHRTRRIRKWGGDKLQLGCGAWKAIFVVKDMTVLVEAFRCGYPDELLMRGPNPEIPDQDAQIAFKTRWPETLLKPRLVEDDVAV